MQSIFLSCHVSSRDYSLLIISHRNIIFSVWPPAKHREECRLILLMNACVSNEYMPPYYNNCGAAILNLAGTKIAKYNNECIGLLLWSILSGVYRNCCKNLTHFSAAGMFWRFFLKREVNKRIFWTVSGTPEWCFWVISWLVRMHL